MPIKVPSIVVGADLRRLSLRSIDALVVSRIDGASSIEELADVLGITEDEVDASIGRLDMLGVIAWSERGPAMRAHKPAPQPKPAVPPQKPPEPQRVATKAASGPITPTHPAPRPPPGQAPQKDPFEDIDLDPDRRARIDFLTSKLEGIDHYTLLGLGSEADKNDVRNAYFGLSKQFHPDTAYGKRLGPYKARMELIFNRLTEAYDTLSKNKRRGEYDETLKRAGRFPVVAPAVPPAGAVTPTSTKARASSPPPAMPSLDDALPTQVGAAPAPAGPPPRPPIKTPVAASAHARSLLDPPRPPAPAAAPAPPVHTPVAAASPISPQNPGQVSVSPQGPAASGASPQTRVAAVGPGPAPVAAPASPPRTPEAPRPAETPKAAGRPQGPASHTLRNLASTLKAAGQVTGSTDRVTRYLKDAREAEAANDYSQALNCLRLARQLAPDRADLATEYERVYRVFVTTHADDLRRRALADEKAGRHADAVQAWLRVCDGRPNDLEAHYAAGRASLASKTELVRARGYLQRAVAIAPHASEGRILLARLYVANGQRPEAVREAEAAAKLYPDDQMLKNLIRELKA